MRQVFGSTHENSEKLGIRDPQKLRMCGQRKYNCENSVNILYSENLVPQKFPCIQYQLWRGMLI